LSLSYKSITCHMSHDPVLVRSTRGTNACIERKVKKSVPPAIWNGPVTAVACASVAAVANVMRAQSQQDG